MKYGPEITKEICSYIRAGNSYKDSATLVDISEETFYQWKKKPEFSEAIKKAETTCKARNIAIIQKAAEKTWQAAAWWLERKYHDEFALKEIKELQGNKDRPLGVVVLPEPYDVSKLEKPSRPSN